MKLRKYGGNKAILRDYTYNEYLETVYGALRTLTDDEKDCILSNLKPHDIFVYITTNEKDKVDEYINELRRTILTSLRYHNALCKLLGIEPVKDKTIVEQYEELDTDSKFNTALALMNEPSFQKDCSEILLADMKRIVESDSTLSAINKLFNITGYYEKALKQGIGCDHKYIVEKQKIR